MAQGDWTHTEYKCTGCGCATVLTIAGGTLRCECENGPPDYRITYLGPVRPPESANEVFAA